MRPRDQSEGVNVSNTHYHAPQQSKGDHPRHADVPVTQLCPRAAIGPALPHCVLVGAMPCTVAIGRQLSATNPPSGPFPTMLVSGPPPWTVIVPPAVYSA
mmetsp:Transcript_10308/g.34409  ORF Transcript_10308/g.34409 Transcript_10308/m.34409 type:complete len:100 (-) Transcript_10308:184-483(-)